MEPFALCTRGSVHSRVTDKTDKDAVSARKEERKKRMHDEIGLLVDTPRAGGSGTSNTGNTARKAFQNESKFAEILGIDPELIHRIHLKLIAVNADILLDLNSFREYGRQTAELWVNKYPHFCMPVSLHQLFILSWEAFPYSLLPDFMEQSRKREQNSQSRPASPCSSQLPFKCNHRLTGTVRPLEGFVFVFVLSPKI